MDSASQTMILPGATIGIFGGGQLGRMLGLVAHRFGYRVVVFCPETESPAGEVADRHIVADYEDPDAIRDFASSVDVITLEFENIPVEALQRAAQLVPVRPGAGVLEVAQHRLREKETLKAAGFPVTPFLKVETQGDLETAGEQLGWPMVLKTASWGYDGKGQRIVRNLEEAGQAWGVLGPGLLVAEKWISFEAEVSIITARSPRGEIACYPLAMNHHANHILDLSLCPAPSPFDRLHSQAKEIAIGVAKSLGVEGLYCIEFFVDADHQLMINEIAPRPHNSGHWSIEACDCSQFEQQLRSICNLPLGSVELRKPTAMANLLGDVWSAGTPKWEAVLSQPSAYLHLYGKNEPRVGRKMGHLTCTAETASEAGEIAVRMRNSLR